MRTRARGPVSPPPSLPSAEKIHPNVTTRKRRSTSATRDINAVVEKPDTDDQHTTSLQTPNSILSNHNGEPRNTNAQLTPRKEIKRVRFSEPVQVFTKSPSPDGDEDDQQVLTSQSTGLTPSLRRTKLLASSATPQRRLSLPALTTTLATSLPTESTVPTIEHTVIEQQYSSLHAILSSRLKRRLKRSHLSEELNAICTSQRNEAEQTRAAELTRLRTESADRARRIEELSLELECQRQLGIAVNIDEEERVTALQNELTTLREELARKEIAADVDGDLPTPPLEDDGEWEDENVGNSPASPLSNRFDFSSSVPRVQMSESGCQAAPETNHAACQTILSHADHEAEIKSFEDIVVRLTRERNDAEATLGLLHQEVRDIWSADEPMGSEERLAAMKNTFRQTRLDLEYLLPGETPGGFDNAALLGDIVKHLKSAVGNVREKTKAINSLQQSEGALRGQFNATLERVSELELALMHTEADKDTQALQLEQNEKLLEWYRAEVRNTTEQLSATKSQLDRAQTQLSSALKEKDTHMTSVERLQKALQTYREEVGSLEKLVNQMEKDKATSTEEVSTLRLKLQQAQTASEANSDTIQQLHFEFQAAANQLGEAQGTRDQLIAEMTHLSQRCNQAEQMLQQHMVHQARAEHSATQRYPCQVDYSSSVAQLERILGDYQRRNEQLDDAMQVDAPFGLVNAQGLSSPREPKTPETQRIADLERKNTDLQAALSSARKLIEFDFARMPDVFAAMAQQYERSRSAVDEFLVRSGGLFGDNQGGSHCAPAQAPGPFPVSSFCDDAMTGVVEAASVAKEPAAPAPVAPTDIAPAQAPVLSTPSSDSVVPPAVQPLPAPKPLNTGTPVVIAWGQPAAPSTDLAVPSGVTNNTSSSVSQMSVNELSAGCVRKKKKTPYDKPAQRRDSGIAFGTGDNEL